MVHYDRSTGKRVALPGRRLGQTRTGANRLLKTVGGKPHATAADHEAGKEEDFSGFVFPQKDLGPREDMKTRRAKEKAIGSAKEILTPPASSAEREKRRRMGKENVDAEPEESEDEGSGKKTIGFVRPDVGVVEEEKPVARFKVPGGAGSPGSPRSSGKRRSSQEEEDNNVDGDPEWMVNPESKKRRVDNASVNNVFAPPRRQKTLGKRPTTYSKTTQRPAAPAKKGGFQKPLEMPDSPQGAKFKKQPEFKSEGPKFLQPESFKKPFTGNANTTLELENDQDLCIVVEDPQIPDTDTGSTFHCPFCREEIEKSVHEDFEDRHGKNFSYKWQRRFCAFHKRLEAETKWRERRYPDIDWIGLERRMRKHDDFLTCVLNDTVDSHYREQLEAKLKPGTKSAKQSYRAAIRPGASVGYYGPKGEKIMCVFPPGSMICGWRADFSLQDGSYPRTPCRRNPGARAQGQPRLVCRRARRCIWIFAGGAAAASG